MENQPRSRGSFVDIRRKSLTFSNIFSNENQERSNDENPKDKMKSYLAALTEEKQEWKNILKRKKIMCEEYKEKYKFEPLTINIKDVEKYISADDKKFLQDKPNYEEMVNSAGKYMDAVDYLLKYKLDIADYYDKACLEVENCNKKLVDNMCADDLCDLCNFKNCQVPEHKFYI